MSFWENADGVSRIRELKVRRDIGKFSEQVMYKFSEYVYQLLRDDCISEKLADKVTLK